MPKDGVCYVCWKTNLRNLYILSLMNVDRACVYEFNFSALRDNFSTLTQ